MEILADWLGNENNYKQVAKHIIYMTYEECKKYINTNFTNINSKYKWYEKLDHKKLPLDVPKRPDFIYKNKGWINWSIFLESNFITPKEKSKLFITYNKAMELMKFKNKIEYLNWIKKENINYIPKRPDYVYRKNWSGWTNFLNYIPEKSSFCVKEISRILNENNRSYETEKIFTDCKNQKRNGYLKFDFYIEDNFGNKILLEYDGELHYKTNKFYGGLKRLKKCQENDKIKDEYCKNNNIKLIRISYKEKHNLYRILNEKLGLIC